MSISSSSSPNLILKSQDINLITNFSRLSRFSITEVIQHSEWNTDGIWPLHYPKYSENRSMTKIEKKVFRFFQFFFSEKSENFLHSFIKETWNSKIDEKITLKISDSKKNEKSKLHIILERWLKSEGNSLRNKKVTADFFEKLNFFLDFLNN